MNQQPDSEEDGLKPEYDFTGAVRGKHHQAYKAGTNVILLDPDVAKAFKNSAQVNRVLRMVSDLAKASSTERAS